MSRRSRSIGACLAGASMRPSGTRNSRGRCQSTSTGGRGRYRRPLRHATHRPVEPLPLARASSSRMLRPTNATAPRSMRKTWHPQLVLLAPRTRLGSWRGVVVTSLLATNGSHATAAPMATQHEAAAGPRPPRRPLLSAAGTSAPPARTRTHRNKQSVAPAAGRSGRVRRCGHVGGPESAVLVVRACHRGLGTPARYGRRWQPTRPRKVPECARLRRLVYCGDHLGLRGDR